MKGFFIVLLLVAVFLASAANANDKKEHERMENAGKVITEIINIPDNIPEGLLDKAKCVVVLPSVVKGAFIVGANYGRGVMTCRGGANFDGSWGAPTMMALEGASFGFQIGGQATDFVLLLMNERSAKGVLTSKVKLGADASAAAGPKGRDTSAETDATMRAEILSYSSARCFCRSFSRGFHATSRRQCQQESVWQRDQCPGYCAEWRSPGATQRQRITCDS